MRDGRIEPNGSGIGCLLHQPFHNLLARTCAIGCFPQQIHQTIERQARVRRIQISQMRKQALRIARPTARKLFKQRLEITRTPKMPLQSPAPLHGHIERVDQRREKAEIPDLHLELRKPRRLHRLDCDACDLDIRSLSILRAQKLCARLIELRRPVGFSGLMAERQAIVAKTRGIFSTALDMHPADRNGEIRPEAKIAPRGVGQHKCPPANFLARSVEENLRRLQH